MSKVIEIESALKELPLPEVRQVANWLQDYLEKQTARSLASGGGKVVQLPDYAAQRKEAFGDLTLPNLVLLAREEERW